MPRREGDDIVVSGIGVTSSIGQGRAAFTAALMAGAHRFGVMRRPGRQIPGWESNGDSPSQGGFLGAEIDGLVMPEVVPKPLLRTVSLSGQVALATLAEAWEEAALEQLPPERIGLIIGGSNVQQRELALLHDGYRGREQFLRPTYGLSFMDSDLCGLCTEVFGIKGFAWTIGGASASGQVAVIEAINAVASGRVEACIALGALADISYWECQGLRSLGAMGSSTFALEPALACRPFDRDRDGFIYGESCGALVIESASSARRLTRQPYARLAGWAMTMDGNRNPNPSVAGEMAVIQGALAMAGLAPDRIDYVNPHGTGSPLGDTTELESIQGCGLGHAALNTTKSVIGHGLSAAGAVELIAILLQMREGQLHPTRNLDHPIEPGLNWVGDQGLPHRIGHALNLSMGFGGVNTAVCLQRIA